MIQHFSRTANASLIIEETKEGFFLYSLSRNGVEGDTWHQSLHDAKAQAIFEFGESEWLPVPDETRDLRVLLRQISH